jgi:hypothetical protein
MARTQGSYFLAYMTRRPFASPWPLAVLALAFLSGVRLIWFCVKFWPMMPLHARVIAGCLVIIFPSAAVFSVRARSRLLRKISADDFTLLGEVSAALLMLPFFFYFGIYLAIELASLMLPNH